MDPHRLAEERSLAIHRIIAERLRSSPELAEAARARVLDWSARGLMHPKYAAEWLQLFEGPRERLLEVIVDGGESSRALRQTTPFTGIVTPKERWDLWRRVARLART